jgi:pilus assembly protein Flp/PilA
LSRFWRDERGATAVEVGFMVALISLAIIGILGSLQGEMSISFGKIASVLDKASSER